MVAWAYLTPMLFAHWLPVGGTACWPFDLSHIGGWTVSVVGGEATGRCVARDGLGVLDPDALCPLTPMLFAHWLPVGGTACWPFDLSHIGGWTVSVVGGEATGRCVARDGLGVLDPDALCPLTPSRRDGLLAVRLESHRGLESRPSPLGGRFVRLGCDDRLSQSRYISIISGYYFESALSLALLKLK